MYCIENLLVTMWQKWFFWNCGFYQAQLGTSIWPQYKKITQSEKQASLLYTPRHLPWGCLFKRHYKGYVAAIPEARKGPNKGLLNCSAKCLLPLSTRMKYVVIRPMVRHHVMPKPWIKGNNFNSFEYKSLILYFSFQCLSQKCFLPVA